MIEIDQVVGTENFPDPPELTFDDLKVAFSVVTSGFSKSLCKLQEQLQEAAKAVAPFQIKKQSDFVLWPPVLENDTRSDKPVKSKHPVYHNKPDFKRKEAITNIRTKQLSRPIGSQGCGFVWNRGRFSP